MTAHPRTTGTQWKAQLMTASTAVAARRGITGPALVGTVFLFTTLAGLAFQTAAAVFLDGDPYRAQGPVESMKGIALFGGISLIVALAVALPLRRDPAKARIGAIALGSLALITLPFFWSGAPAIFGAAAAWLAGLVTPVPIRLVDERLTTVTASRALHEAGRDTRRQRAVIDQAAAVAVLDHALDAERATGKPAGEVVPREGLQA